MAVSIPSPKRSLCGDPRVALVMAVVLVAACESRSPLRIRPGPIVQQQQSSGLTRAAFKRIAVIPFHSAEQRRGPLSTGPNQADEAVDSNSGDLIGRFVTEALANRGYDVIPPSDVTLAFEAAGVVVPRLDVKAGTGLAQRSFGATAILIGRVIRYREREGSALGSTHPASVAFEVSLHEVSTGRRLWTGRFDETQQSITANIFRAGKYPGGGSRWLTAAELARWGAGEVAKSMAPVH